MTTIGEDIAQADLLNEIWARDNQDTGGKFYIGQPVKFIDNAAKSHAEYNLEGRVFDITGCNLADRLNDGTEVYEYSLRNVPFLVWEDEIEEIK